MWTKYTFISFPASAALAEALAVFPQAIDRVNYPFENNDYFGWKGLTLYGKEWNELNRPWNIGDEPDETLLPYKWTQIADDCPTIVSWLKGFSFFKRYGRIRFSYLLPGGYIGLYSYIVPVTQLHIPLNVPLDSSWEVKNTIGDLEKIPLETDAAFEVDLSSPHQLKNDSTEIRIHLVINGRD